MAEHRTVSERYAQIGARLVETEDLLADLRGSGATVVYLASDRERRSRGRPVYGACERVADKDKWAVPADFVVVVYEPNCQGMDDEHVSRLIFHELLHVGIDAGRDGGEAYRVRPHDLEDFRECVRRWGPDWERG